MMVFFRKMLVLLVCFCTSMGFLIGCGTSAPALLSPDTIAQQVGAHYQENHPHISNVLSTQTEYPSHEQMYSILITGHFQEGKLVASSLSFSALATRMYVWDIYAYDQMGKDVWFDHEWKPTSS